MSPVTYTLTKGDDRPYNVETGELPVAGITVAPSLDAAGKPRPRPHYNKIEVFGDDCKTVRDLILARAPELMDPDPINAPSEPVTVEEMCRRLLIAAHKDGVVVSNSEGDAVKDEDAVAVIDSLSSGDLVGMANLLSAYLYASRLKGKASK